MFYTDNIDDTKASGYDAQVAFSANAPSRHIKRRETLEEEIAKFLNNGGRIVEVPKDAKSEYKPYDYNQRGGQADRNPKNKSSASKPAIKSKAAEKPITEQKRPVEKKTAPPAAPPVTPASKPANDVRAIAEKIQALRQATPAPNESVNKQTPEQKVQVEEAQAAKPPIQKPTTAQAQAEKQTRTKKGKAKKTKKLSAKKGNSKALHKGTGEPAPVRKKRLADMHAAKLAAQMQGETKFIATCFYHRQTTYIIDASNCARCEICLKNRTKEHPTAYVLRMENNRIAAENAVATGATVFTGECYLHKQAPFTLKDDQTSDCNLCQAVTDAKLARANEKAEQERKRAEQQAAKIAKEEQKQKDRIAKAKQKQKEIEELAKLKAKNDLVEQQKIIKAEMEAARKKKQSRAELRAQARKEQVWFSTGEPLQDRKVRLTKVKTARSNAAKIGETKFIAPCYVHQETLFRIDSEGHSRCVKCSTSKSRNQSAQRTEFNRKAKENAIAAGESTYIGQCKSHHETLFKIDNAGSGRCCSCKQNSYKRNYSKSKTIINLNDFKDINSPVYKNSTTLRVTLTELKNLAISKRKLEFLAPCMLHGLTTFRITRDPQSGLLDNQAECVDCVNEIPNINQDQIPVFEYKTEYERMQLVNTARKQAAAKNEVYFYAPCAEHHTTLYTTFGDISRCLKCIKGRNKKHASDEDKENYDRVKELQVLAINAHFKRLSNFIATCKHHGLAPYVIKVRPDRRNKIEYYCMECSLIRNQPR